MNYILALLFLFNGIITENKVLMDENERRQRFLNTIAQIESSGGKNFEHKTVTKGVQAGHRGIGRYGLMPNTVGEVLNRMRLQGSITPELSNLRQLDPDSLKETLENNPELEDQIAQALAQRVLERQQDEEKAAYSWNMGHNLTPQQIEEQPYQESDYVQKYNTYKKLLAGD